MKRLSKTQIAERNDIVKRLGEAESHLSMVIDEFNGTLERLFAPIEAAMSAVNDLRNEAAGFRDGIVSDMESYAGERSEKWQDSDAGNDFESWKGEWENIDFEEIQIECPEQVDPPDSISEEFEALPEEAS